VHCFDSFAGLTEFKTEDAAATANRGRYAGSLPELQAMAALYRLTTS